MTKQSLLYGDIFIMRLSVDGFLKKILPMLVAIVCSFTVSHGQSNDQEQSTTLDSLNESKETRDFNTQPPALEMRMGFEQLRDPFWYEAHGYPNEAKYFWDRKHWENVLRQWSEQGYNALLYWPEPWTEASFQSFLIRYKEFPEARVLADKQYARVIEHVNWIFTRAHELGLKNYMFAYQVVTTKAFAKTHGMDKDMPVSETVDWRHNLKQYMGMAYGVRNEKTRAFTEAAVAELFHTYKDLDGLIGQMGEALPGKRSSWFREAVVPGLERSGRKPAFFMMNWMMPLDEFLEDIVSKDVYENLWITMMANVEMFTDAKPYPAALRWAEESNLPTIFEIVHHNHEANFPANSPRLAYEIVQEYKKINNCKGFLAWFLRYDPNPLFRKALGYYGKNDVPYSDEPWVDVLEKRYGDRKAAQHFLNAHNTSARIPPELTAIAWCPMDRGVSQILMLPYWYWTDQDPRWSYMVSPSRAGILLPVRHYARVVAKHGATYRNNNGSDYTRNKEHPGAQEIFWGLGYYPTMPEAHMRNIRRLGEESLREAEEARKTVKKNVEEAERVYNYMKAYKLLTDFYEKKVLAASAALIYGFGQNPLYKAEAEHLADEAVAKYEIAINFIWENIDKKSGDLKGRWGREFTLPELIENEKRERTQIADLFNWPAADRASEKSSKEHTDEIGADWVE